LCTAAVAKEVPVAQAARGCFDESDDEEQPGLVTDQSEDEVRRYLALPRVKEMHGGSPLQWWAKNQWRFPTIAPMARTYLGCPASTAGLERMFSAAGRMHNDFKKSTSEVTLEHMLMARYNTNPK
jgi:hypothetical protein